MKQIILKTPGDIDKGYALLLHNGTVVYTGEKGRYIVPDESIELLRQAGIKFEIKPVIKTNK
jgi:archaellum component FlaF (FlaF/FlaG flagellin family)